MTTTSLQTNNGETASQERGTDIYVEGGTWLEIREEAPQYLLSSCTDTINPLTQIPPIQAAGLLPARAAKDS
jgi:hypothetical protein